MCCLCIGWEEGERETQHKTLAKKKKVEKALWFCSTVLHSPGITTQLVQIVIALIQLPKKLKQMQNKGSRTGAKMFYAEREGKQ